MALDAGHIEELIIEEVYEDEIEPEDKELARDDENDMEEGEISGQEDLFQPVRGIKARLGRRVHNPVSRGPLNTTRLPDLLREIGSTGAEALDPAFTERIEARAKRFNLKSSGNEITHPDFINLYKSFQISEDEYSGKFAEGTKKFRMEAIQLSGLIPGTKAEDILEFFGDIVPATYEWVNSNTCNVIWALSPTAAKAMLTLSRPISIPKRDDGDNSDNDLINVHNLEDDAVMEDVEEPEVPKANVTDDKNQSEQKRHRILKAFEGPVHSVIEYKDLECAPPSNEVWRYAKPGSRLGDSIFMRIPRLVQLRRPQGVDDASKDQALSGGIWSSSHKRRVREAIQYERDALVEFEKQKKYSGPVGKDPWGTIAQDWTKVSTGQPIDYAAELAVFRDLCNHRNTLTRPNKIFTNEHRSDLTAKDWDNPENFEVGIGAKPTRGFKRLRSFSDDSDSDEDGKFPASRLDGRKIDRWEQKLKKPRMKMVADEEESKISAKRRILKTAKRRLRVAETFPAHTSRSFDSDDESFSHVHARRERFTLQVENNQFVPSPGSKLSLRLQNRLGNKPGIQSQIGKRVGGHESDDSLENANDFGLRSEIGAKRFDSMLIRINRSPGHVGNSSDGEMDEDEEIQEVSSRTSKPMSVVHVKEEIPFQPRIKNEQEEEERKSRRKDGDRRQEGSEKRHHDESAKRYQEELDDRRREAVIKRRREEKEERERESRKKLIEARRREDAFKTKSKAAEEGRRKATGSRKTVAVKIEGAKKKAPIRIKKEKFSDDSSSSDSSDEDSSSSSSSGSSSSTSSSSSSSDSSSSSSSSDSSSGEETSRKAGKKPVKKLSSVSERNRKSGKVAGEGNSSDKLKDKLKEYLSKAKKK